MTAIIRLVLYALLIMLVSILVTGISIASFWPAAVVVGILFALINAIITAVLPNNIVFALIAIVLNAVALYALGYYIAGFDVAGLADAVVGGIIAAIGAWLINEVF